jgi:hypothetical protein
MNLIFCNRKLQNALQKGGVRLEEDIGPQKEYFDLCEKFIQTGSKDLLPF